MKSIMQAVVLGGFVVVAAIDVVLYCYGGTPATISAWIWATSRDFPILPFAAGVVMGHLFWQVPATTPGGYQPISNPDPGRPRGKSGVPPKP